MKAAPGTYGGPDALGVPVVPVNTVCLGLATVGRVPVSRARVSRVDYRW